MRARPGAAIVARSVGKGGQATMTTRWALSGCLALVPVLVPAPTSAHSFHHGMGHHGHWGYPATGHPTHGPVQFPPTIPYPGPISGGYSGPIWVVVPPPVVIVSDPPPPPLPPWPGLDPVAPAARQARPAVPLRRNDPARSEKLIELGDHLFRSGNISRALRRFQQAARADASSSTPHVRLAQIALARGKYTEAADEFRQAEAAEPGWLARALDIQALYAEPADFARLVAKLESYLQAHPDDRDAWFVLGANWYLSGRTKKAADVFLRLSDRKVDSSLAAFLDAATPPDR